MTNLNPHAEAHRAAAALIEQHPDITHLAVHPYSDGTVGLHVTAPDALCMDIVATGDLGDVTVRMATWDGKQWLTVENGRYRGFTLHLTGPHVCNVCGGDGQVDECPAGDCSEHLCRRVACPACTGPAEAAA
jgi:hypothetical protein